MPLFFIIVGALFVLALILSFFSPSKFGQSLRDAKTKRREKHMDRFPTGKRSRVRSAGKIVTDRWKNR